MFLGLVLSQAIFLAYMVVLRKLVNAGLAASLIVFTVVMKIMYASELSVYLKTY